jgi:uncharacterized protein YbjT (DUF2867 family)
MLFFVAGITGHVGGATARHLLQAGHQVRGLVRNPQKAEEWAKQGVEVRQGDFGDAAAVAGALEGVEGAYLMLPPFFTPSPGFPEAQALVDSYREALRRVPSSRVVALSSVGSEKSSGLGLITSTHLLEEGLRDLPFPVAFVRAGSFFENYAYAVQAAASGWFDSFLTPTDRAFPMVATEDIGKEVAQLLTGEWSGNKIVELGSRLSADDVATALSEVLGQPVRARAIPREQWTATLEAQGMPAAFIGPYVEMEDGLLSGWIDFGVAGTEAVAGTVTLAEFFAKVKNG